jgi:phosphoglycolate phosphatase-like HAD superfamily hydrolase
MSNNYKYVVFDFDGVVCDSTNECMVTAWNAWERWNKKDGFRRSLVEFDQCEIENFRPLRPYVRGAGEYYILMRAINSSNYIISNQKYFDELRLEWKDQLSPFKAIFFQERQRLRSENLNSWIELHEVYDDVIKVMKYLHDQGRLLIATLKDGESVRLILNKNEINILPEEIMDQSKISSKLEALKIFVSEKKIYKNELCFIDDNVTHLLEPYKSGYNVYLTGWGNTMLEHKEIAEKENIPIIQTINQFFNYKYL